jgi:hypothetical protein
MLIFGRMETRAIATMFRGGTCREEGVVAISGGKPETLMMDIVHRESRFGLSTDSGQRGVRHCARAVAKVGRSRRSVP